MGYEGSHIKQMTQAEARQVLDLGLPVEEYVRAKKSGRDLTTTVEEAQKAAFEARQAARRAMTQGEVAQTAEQEAKTKSPEDIQRDVDELALLVSRALGLRNNRSRAGVKPNPKGPGVVIKGRRGADTVVRFGNEADAAKARAQMKALGMEVTEDTVPNGYYDNDANEIVLFKDKASDFTLNHEVIHFFQEAGLLSDEDIVALTTAAEEATLEDGTSLVDMVRQRYKGQKDRFGKELIAEYVEGVKSGTVKPKQRTLVDKVLDFLRDVARILGFGVSPRTRIAEVMSGAPIARKPSTRWKNQRQQMDSQPDPSPEATERVNDILGSFDGAPARQLAEENQLAEPVDSYDAGDVVRSPLHFSAHTQPQAFQAGQEALREAGAPQEFIDQWTEDMQEIDTVVKSVIGKDINLFPRSQGDPYRGSRPGAQGPIRDNSDGLYIYSYDLVSSCIRRVNQAATSLAVSERLGKPLTSDQEFAVALVMRKQGKLAQCIECYVESARRTMGDSLNKWRDFLNGTKKFTKGKAQGIGAFKEQQEFIAAAKDAGLTGDHIDVDRLLDPKNGGKMPNPTLTLASGREVQFQNFVLSLASAKVNKIKLYQEYIDQILSIPEGDTAYLNKRAGLRFFSSSDFQAEHAIDLAQALFHMSLREMRGHAYTKIDDFVRIFGGSGLKIQTSVFGVTKGNDVLPDTRAGYDWEMAKRRREEFPDVGTCFVAKDDVQVNWALKQDWIDYIIPFHHSGMSKEHMAAINFQDYTTAQVEKWRKWKTKNDIPKHLQRRVKKVGGGYVLNPAKALKRHKDFISETVSLAKGVEIVKSDGYRIAKGKKMVPDITFSSKRDANAWLKSSDYADTHEVVESPVYDIYRDGDRVNDSSFQSDTAARKFAKKPSKESDRDSSKRLYEVGGKPNIPSAYIFGQDGTTNEAAKARYLDLCDEMGVIPVFEKWRDHPNYIKLRRDYARTDTPFRPVNHRGIDMGEMSGVLTRYIGDFRDIGGRQAQVEEDAVNEMMQRIENDPEGQLSVRLLQEEADANARRKATARPDSIEGTDSGTSLYAEKWRKIAKPPKGDPKAAAIFNSPIFRQLAGRRNLDLGGSDAIVPEGTVNLIYSPVMPQSRNISLAESLQRDPVQTVTVRGHLDTASPNEKAQLVKQAAAALEHDGSAFFYTTDPTGTAKLVRKYFGKVQRKGNIIVGTGVKADTSHLYFSLPNGRPNYANPAMTENPETRNAHDDMLDVVNETRPIDPDTVTEWEEAARARIATPEGAAREYDRIHNLTSGYFDPATQSVKTMGLNPTDMVIARMLVDRLYNQSQYAEDADTREKAFSRYIRMVNMYRDAGTDVARAMRARHDQTHGPAARLNIFRSMVAEMPSDLRTARQKALSKNDLKAVRRIDMRWQARVSRLLFSLQKEGYDLSDLAEGERLMNNDYAVKAMRKIMSKKRRVGSRIGDMIMESYYIGMLSGTLTHVRNLLGNTIMGAYEMTAQKWSEAAVGSVARMFGGEAATTWSELGPLYKGVFMALPKALQNSFRSLMAEEDMLEADIIGIEEDAGQARSGKLERRRMAAWPGKLGKIYRGPLSMLSAEDSFFKTIFSRSIVGALAHKSALEQGLKGDQRANYINGVLGDYGHPLWQEALAQAKELTFQTPLPSKLNKIVSNLRTWEIPGTGITPAVLFIPFITVPYNIYRVALKTTPLGSLSAVAKLIWHDHFAYTGKEFQRDLARQLIAWPLFLLVRGMMKGDDEDDPRPALTGAIQDPTRNGFREFQYMALPPMSKRNDDGTWTPYSNLDPISTALSTMVDSWNAWDMKGSPGEKAGFMIGQLVDSAEDRTFLRGMADMVNMLRRPGPTFERMMVRVPATFVPNMYRQPARGMDEYLRYSKMLPAYEGESWWDMYWRHVKAQAVIGPETRLPRLDYFGRDVQLYTEVGSSMGAKLYESMLNPRTKRKDMSNEFALMVYRWNELHPEEPWYPSTPSPKVTLLGEQREMTQGEFYSYSKIAGQETLKLLKAMNPNTKEPGEYDKKVWETAQRYGRMIAKSRVFGDEEYPQEKVDAAVKRVNDNRP